MAGGTAGHPLRADSGAHQVPHRRVVPRSRNFNAHTPAVHNHVQGHNAEPVLVTACAIPSTSIHSQSTLPWLHSSGDVRLEPA